MVRAKRESVQTTLEEASRCYKCENPGKFVGARPARARAGVTRGAQIHMYMCVNPRCKRYEQIVRAIQVNPDGTIPPADTSPRNQFPALRGGKAETQRVVDTLVNQVDHETSAGGELPARRW